jgi:hypothetical protein
VGTRFLASEEASADEGWKRAILESDSEDAIRFEAWERIFPPAGGGAYATVPRVMRTRFVQVGRSQRRLTGRHTTEAPEYIHALGRTEEGGTGLCRLLRRTSKRSSQKTTSKHFVNGFSQGSF